ncbi:MAG TPA: hypothetical protein VK610_07170, partial [Rhodothermales bacterium]|nr:hypothetical protein [Rhodothermales bacterium]
EGGKQKSVGVQFPLGMMGAGRPPGNGPGSGSGGGRRGGPPSEAEMAERFQASLGQLALRRGERDPGERRGVEAVPGLEVAAVLDRGQLVYELRVPLQSEGGFAVGAAPGATVGLGLETPQPARGARERGGPGGERGPGAGGGRPPGGGGMGGGGGMSRPGGGRGGAPASEPFERWVRVVLARP